MLWANRCGCGGELADERLAPAADDGVIVMVGPSGQQTRRLQLHRTATGRGISRACWTGRDRAIITPGLPCPRWKGRRRRWILP